MKDKIKYHARLNRNIYRTPYGMKTTYKKGTIICDFTQNEFKKLTIDNIHRYTDLSLCEGHSVYEYFDLKDI